MKGCEYHITGLGVVPHREVYNRSFICTRFPPIFAVRMTLISRLQHPLVTVIARIIVGLVFLT